MNGDHTNKAASDGGGLATRIGRLQTSNYDISNVCNLRCEGCLYFSGAGLEVGKSENDIEVWEKFFLSEAQRGVTFAYLGGAEPSLTPDRIRACHEQIPMGTIFTNGTKKIESDIRYRIHVSLWGNEDSSELYRGANVNRKAMLNYKGDPRAVFVMTLNALNLDEIPDVARACQDHGLPLVFSLFSPTLDYNKRMSGTRHEESDYFRFSSGQSDMRFGEDMLHRARDAIFDAASRFPKTIRISPAFINWVTRQESLYTLDERGVAIDCGNRLTRRHVHFNADLTRNSEKCCAPNLDCRDCRPYAMSLATYFSRRRQMPDDWEGVWQYWREIFGPLPEDEKALEDSSEMTT
jgi:MoaA/NifB/PqqE/SkfB family radical SAM enzyme